MIVLGQCTYLRLIKMHPDIEQARGAAREDVIVNILLSVALVLRRFRTSY